MYVFVQEGANINKSLTTLGKVISALAELVGFLHFPKDLFRLGILVLCYQINSYLHFSLNS